MSSSREFLWFLSCLQDKCPVLSLKHNFEAYKVEVKRGAYKDPTIQVHKFLVSPEPYSHLAGALFHEDPKKGAIPILQAHGYYLKGNIHLFENNPRPMSFLQILECLMWAYLDTCLPKNEITKAIGSTKTTACSDAESTLIMWVNTLAKKHQKLQPITAFAQNFFCLPHFRCVLYHFLLENELLVADDPPEKNAEVALKRATQLGLEPPFEISDFLQPPLIIMCYLCRCAIFFSSMKPPKPPRIISKSDIQQLIFNIEVKKKEIIETEKRVQNLTLEVGEIAENLKRYTRPQSMLTLRHRSRSRANNGNGQESPNRAKSSLGEHHRVKWAIPEETLQKMISTPKKNMTEKYLSNGMTRKNDNTQNNM